MIKKRIIPTLSFKNNGLVKSTKFQNYRMLGDPIQTIKIYNLRDVDELIFVDISDKDNRPNFSLVRQVLQYAFMPITVGGGINSLQDISFLLASGADKVCIAHKALDYDFVTQAVNLYGQQAIVISIDYFEDKEGAYLVFNPGFSIYRIDVIEHIKKLSRIGVSEFIITAVEKDGSMQGYDIDFLKRLDGLTQAGLIINGGAGTYQHMFTAFEKTNIVGVAAASMFHFTEQTPKGANQYLKENHIKVRN